MKKQSPTPKKYSPVFRFRLQEPDQAHAAIVRAELSKKMPPSMKVTDTLVMREALRLAAEMVGKK